MSTGIKYPVTLSVKVKNISSLLADKIGIIVSGKKCIAIVLKSTNIIEIYSQLDTGSHLFIWAICGLASEGRAFENEFRRLKGRIKSYFSERDLNIYLVTDFISSYMSSEFYNRKSDKPVALEFILGEVTDQQMIFCAIGFDGNIRKLEETEGISVIGCANEAARKEISNLIAGLNVAKKKSSSVIIKLVQPLLDKFSGRFKGTGFDFKPKKPQQESPQESPQKK